MTAADRLADLVAAHDAKREAIGRGMTIASIALALTRATDDLAQAFADRLHERADTT